MMCKVDVVAVRVLQTWADGNRQVIECTRYLEAPGHETQVTVDAHPHYDVVIPIFDRRKAFGIGSRAGSITRNRRRHVERLMWALGVVDRTPCIECVLGCAETGEVAATEQFSLERAMKPLILAIGLRMGRPAVGQPHAQADQPDAQRGELSGLGGAAPGRAVIGVDA